MNYEPLPARLTIAEAIRELDDDPALPRYVDKALDVFGVESRDLGGDIQHLLAGPHMLDGLPGLVKGEEGFSATFDRQRALARDDVQRLSWEHPLVREMMELTGAADIGMQVLDGMLAQLETSGVPPQFLDKFRPGHH